MIITDDGIQVPGKQIQLHTNQTNDLLQNFSITANTAINTFEQISEFAVGGNTSGTNSSYSCSSESVNLIPIKISIVCWSEVFFNLIV